MADLSALKSAPKKPTARRGFGAPPSLEEASSNLAAPEVAPAAAGAGEVRAAAGRIDGRSARRTNRTIAFATRITPELDKQIQDIAEREGILKVELLERAIEAYEELRGQLPLSKIAAR